MLKYGLTETFAEHLLEYSLKERVEILWKIQGVISHVPGYLRLKVDGSEEEPIYQISKNIFVLAHDDYAARIIEDVSSEKEDLKKTDSVYSSSIVDLLAKKELDERTSKIFKIAIDNHFPTWFLNLLNLLPDEKKDHLLSENQPVESEIKEEKAATDSVVVKQAPAIDKETPVQRIVSKQIEIKPQAIISKPNKPKQDVDGERFEKEMLRQLAKAYELRKKTQKVIPNKPLSHVKFAPKEIIVSYSNMDECLFLAQKRTTKLGCRNCNDDWKFLLALSVDESIAEALERRYPGHVCYTDEPNKGNLKTAFIVKPAKERPEEDLDIKPVSSKTASFQASLPSGAFENIDDEDVPERIYHSSFKPMIQKHVVHVSNEVRTEQIEEQMEEFFDDEFEFDDMPSGNAEISEFPSQRDDSPSYPAHWHCHLCGKKKLYSGEPAETVELSSGKIVYLCAKHRGKM